MGITLSLSLSRSRLPRTVVTCTLVFLLCLYVGILSGTLLKNNNKDTQASSASITVTDNNQVVDVDKSTGTTTITKTSTVTIKDPLATKGYLLTAQLSATTSTIPGATVSAYSTSPASIHCSETDPCLVTTDKPRTILYPIHNNNATAAQGETTTLTITMTIPAGTDLGQYILDIEYQEQPVIPIQDIDETTCTTSRSIAYDARNSEIYYIQKIPASGQGNKDLCWMESNLRYGGGGNNVYGDRTTITLHTNDQLNDNATPEYINPEGSTDYTNTTASGGFYGYFYNWCATTGGQTNGCGYSTAGIDTAISVCPSGWRLPTSGTLPTTDSDFSALNRAVNNGLTGSNAADQGLRNNWLGVYNGYYAYSKTNDDPWIGYFGGRGSYGQFWSSTQGTSYYSGMVNGMLFGTYSSSPTVYPGGINLQKGTSSAVRCVKDVTPLQNGMNMQDVTVGQCDITPIGTTVNLKDTRDGKYYRVRKMADSRCWMIDNLAFSLLRNDTGTATNTGAPAYSPAAQVDATPAGAPNLTSVETRAQYAMNNNIAGQGQIPNNGNPTPSYLYNWCAAMGDTSTNCATTVAYAQYQPSTPQVGVCPGPADASGFRLPMVGSTPAPSTPGNGSNQAAVAATTTNEFAKLDIWLGGTGMSYYPTSSSAYPNFMTDSITNPQLFWSGVLGGFYSSGLSSQNQSGYWWSSTAASDVTIYDLDINIVAFSVSHSTHGKEYGYGFSVRCVL